jgi:ribulose-5-phosphate 4-epimerase/fuculose-1-phosphate aldolase
LREGVIKFNYELIDAELPCELFSDLRECRNKLFVSGLIGVYKSGEMRGIGYGNVSKRVNWNGKEGFIITGSQTGHITKLPCEKYCFIEDYNIEKNFVRALGKIKPSSEALSHASIYEQNEKIKAVVHVHSKEIFAASKTLGLPYTGERASYGSVALAKELAKAFKEFGLGSEGIIITLGHEEGVFSWAENIARASEIILDALKKAKEML